MKASPSTHGRDFSSGSEPDHIYKVIFSKKDTIKMPFCTYKSNKCLLYFASETAAIINR